MTPLKPRPLTLGMVQMACTADPAINRTTAAAGARDCAQRGAKLIILQELVTTLYFCQEERSALFDLAEDVPGPTSEFFSALSRELGVVLVVPFFERRAPGLYHNSALVFESDGSLAGHYRKMHIPDDPGYYEKFYFIPGDLGFQAIPTSVGKLGVLICWDQWFPEAARLTALAGADLLIYPTAIGWKPDDFATGEGYRESWKTSMRGHAVANGLHVVAVNRVGQEEGMAFWGGSFIADPSGHLLFEAGRDAVNHVHTIDLAATEQTRREWPFLRDRRVDAYGNLLKLWGK